MLFALMLPLLNVSAIAAFATRPAAEWLAGRLGTWLGIWKTLTDSGSPGLKKAQALREYQALLGATGTGTPEESVCQPCAASSKGRRRLERQELMRAAQNRAMLDPVHGGSLFAAAQRLTADMDRVEDARLSQHTYTANEDAKKQADYLQSMRTAAPPGFFKAPIEQVAADFGLNPSKLKRMINPQESSQRIEIYQRDENTLGPGPKYTVAFRGSTTDERDWNNNSKNELGFEAPHQAKAIRLGEMLKNQAARQGKDIRSMISTTGHSKGGSEAQAFAAAAGVKARVFNPAGFDPKQYNSLRIYGVTAETMDIDRTSVVNRDAGGNVLEEGTDPLYYAQHESSLVSRVMKRPVTTGKARELAPIAPSLTGPSGEVSDSEAHSMTQVIEALERDKKADEEAIKHYLSKAPPPPRQHLNSLPSHHANSTRQMS